ncbi:MAG: DUF4440 domain-containing protein [Gemmatimonadetes bacterium]|nr:DUF4440 domain-containing protein [Gemmatimonadota bacterium]
MRRTLVLLVALTAARLPAQQPPSIPLPAALERVLRDYEQGWEKGDAAAVARLFTTDGFALPNGKPPAKGHAAIAAAYRGNAGPLRLRALSFATADSVGWIVGAYAYGERSSPDIGKFVLALRKDPTGRWLIAADIDNASKSPS